MTKKSSRKSTEKRTRRNRPQQKFLRRLATLEQLERRELFAVDFRAFDGTDNNLLNPEWGSTDENFLRIAPAEYSDGLSAPAGDSRLSPREISNIVSSQSPDTPTNSLGLTAMLYAWGQFLDHDIDLTLSADPAEAFPIEVPTGDPYFDPTGSGSATIGLTRSQYDSSTGLTSPREQFNSITAFIDGSMVYGNSAEEASSLRTGEGGHMRTSDGNLLPMENGMFLTGDIRANENPDLTSLQTLFVREHNRIADELASTRPNWTDERLFQEARKIVVGELQAITYNEFLPALIGNHAIAPYRGYNPEVNPGISNEFATAAYRFGHSLVGDDIEFLNNEGEEIADPVSLRDAFFNPSIVSENGIDPILKYLASDHAQEVDPYIIDDLRNFLFGPPGSGGLDLAALNIQRGRDHGLADYNSVREAYGLARVDSFADITSDPNLQASLEEAYGSVDNIDLWVGGLAEDHVRGAAVGPLFQRIIADQFTRLRDGDRYYYENYLSGSALRQVRSTSLADVIRRNTETTNLQENVFVLRTSVAGRIYQDSNGNGVFDRREAPVVGVSVNLVDENGDVVATSQTARNGVYRFRETGLGTFSVQLQLPETVDPKSVEVSVTKGEDLREVNLGLSPEEIDIIMAEVGRPDGRNGGNDGGGRPTGPRRDANPPPHPNQTPLSPERLALVSSTLGLPRQDDNNPTSNEQTESDPPRLPTPPPPVPVNESGAPVENGEPVPAPPLRPDAGGNAASGNGTDRPPSLNDSGDNIRRSHR